MSGYQKFRGNPENKLFFLLNNFMGGINTEFSDDSSNDTDFDSIINFDMDKLGTLNKRNGFGELIAISEIFNKLDKSYLPNILNRTKTNNNPENSNDNLVYMKLLRNDNNCFRNLSGFSGDKAYREYQSRYGFQNNSFVLLMITTKLTNGKPTSSKAWYYVCTLPELEYDGNGEPTDKDTMTINCYTYSFPITFNWDRNLMNMDTIEYFDKIWFTNNKYGLVCFNRSAQITSNDTLASAFTYHGVVKDGVINSAYKPTTSEMNENSALGPNLLCTDPLHDVGDTTTSVDTLLGVYFTTTDNIFLSNQIVPGSEPFLLNILYTGSSNFTITAKSGDEIVDLKLTEKTSLNKEGFKVYEVEFKNVPSGEVELKIEKTGVSLSPCYRYITTGVIDGNLKPVTALNIGECGMCEMSGRAVYYKDDTLYFSDINHMDYIPANNYIILPIEPTDKITKVCYFKGVYIVFTKEKIFKLKGTYGSSDFSREYVNSSLGCHAGNTVVPIEDTLYFASPRGMYALKSSTFVEGMQNLKELDLKVKKLTSDYTIFNEELSRPAIRFNGISERAYALRYKDKYLLFYNNYNDKGDYAASNDLDTLVYQYEIGAYTTYRFKEKPTFLFIVDNAIETFSTIYKEQLYTTSKELINYNFETNAKGSRVITDLSGNNNNCNVVRSVAINGKKGINLSQDYARGEFSLSNLNLSNGFSITFNIQFDESCLNNNHIILCSLGDSEKAGNIQFVLNISTESKSFGIEILNEPGVSTGLYSDYKVSNLELTERHTWKINTYKNGAYQVLELYKDNVRVSSNTYSTDIFDNTSLDGDREICDLCTWRGILEDGTLITGVPDFKGSIYSFSMSNNTRVLFDYEFEDSIQGDGVTYVQNKAVNYEDLMTLYNVNWYDNTGASFNGIDGYLELPNISQNVSFLNGFTIEFEGSFVKMANPQKIFDLATKYNNDNEANKNSSINCSIFGGGIRLETNSVDYVSANLVYNLDITENHKYKFDCVYNLGGSYTLSLYLDNGAKPVKSITFTGAISNITRFSNFIGKSNTTTDNLLNGNLKNFKISVYEGEAPTLRSSIFEFDTTPTDFGKSMYVELISKATNMLYPQHMKKLKHIFVKCIGGYNYNEFFFELYADAHLVNDPKTYYTYLDENGTVVYDYTGDKELKLKETTSILGNIRLDETALGTGKYQTRKLVIPEKAKNFSCHIYGDTSDYISLESIGFVCKLGKVKEG